MAMVNLKKKVFCHCFLVTAPVCDEVSEYSLYLRVWKQSWMIRMTFERSEWLSIADPLWISGKFYTFEHWKTPFTNQRPSLNKF